MASTTAGTTAAATTTKAKGTMTTAVPTSTVAPTTSSLPIKTTTGATTAAPTEATTTTEAVTTTKAMEPVIECPLDMTDTSRLPTPAMKPKANIREKDFVQWNGVVDANTPYEVQALLAQSEEDLPLTTKFAVTINVEDVQLILTIVGKETQDAPIKTQTITMPVTEQPNVAMEFPSATQKTLPFVELISLKLITTSETPLDLKLRLHLECCIKPGRVKVFL